MSTHRSLLLAALAAVTTGCCSFGVCAKRESELNCPTDVRKTVPWCAGEDAVFHCPCGPEGNFYGHRATCWRDWPTSAAAWRDMSCGPTVIAESTSSGEPNPFRGQFAPPPVPERIPAPIELPPLPLTQPPGIQQPYQIPQPKAIDGINDKAESLGPPVLPPKTTAIERPASPTGAMSKTAAVAAPQDAKVKFVAATQRLPLPATVQPRPAVVEPAAAAVQVAHESAVDHAMYSLDQSQESDLFVLSAETVAASSQSAAQPRAAAPLSASSPAFVRPSIRVNLVR